MVKPVGHTLAIVHTVFNESDMNTSTTISHNVLLVTRNSLPVALTSTHSLSANLRISTELRYLFSYLHAAMTEWSDKGWANEKVRGDECGSLLHKLFIIFNTKLFFRRGWERNHLTLLITRLAKYLHQYLVYWLNQSKKCACGMDSVRNL